MSIRARLALTASIVALGAALPASATQFYVGAGLEVGNSEMSDAGSSEFDGDLTAGSLIAGVLVPIDDKWFVAAEGETTLFTSYDPDVYSGGDDIDRIWRLRARGGYDFGQWSVYGAVGGVWVEGPIAGTALEDSADGLTYGAGVEYGVSDKIDLRLELIHDETEFESGSYEWDNTSLRAGATIKF